MKKYILLPMGFRSLQIRAIRSFGDVKAGDFGGFVDRNSTLSHKGKCWVSKGVRVVNSFISGDVQILNDARNTFGESPYYMMSIYNSRIIGKGTIKNTYLTGSFLISKNINITDSKIAYGNMSGNITIKNSEVSGTLIKGKCLISNSEVRDCTIKRDTSIVQGKWYRKKMYGGEWIF